MGDTVEYYTLEKARTIVKDAKLVIDEIKECPRKKTETI